MRTRDRETETAGRLLRRVAQRARTRPPFMAWLLAQAQTLQGCSEAQLAARARAAAGPAAPGLVRQDTADEPSNGSLHP